MTKEELKLTSKEALKKIKKLIFIMGEILVAESKQDISQEEAIQRIRKTFNKYGVNRTGYETIKQDLDRLEKLEKENQELKGKVNHFEKVIEDIKNMPDCDFKKTLIDIGFKHMFDNCKLTPLPEVKELKMTSKEALSDLFNMANYCLEEKEQKQIKEEYNLIKKDLEILEILKKHCDFSSPLSMNYFIEFFIYNSDEEFEKVKEWLTNE